MTEQEIENRILVCEMRERDYREVGNTKTADRYSNEKYKWEKLLSKLDSKRDEQLADYKKGYSRLEKTLNEIKEYINTNEIMNNEDGTFLLKECYYGQEILQIINKSLGENL